MIKPDDTDFDKALDKKRKLRDSLSGPQAGHLAVERVYRLRTDRLIRRPQIPIYDLEGLQGLFPLSAEGYGRSILSVMETSLIPKCDGGLRIVGDSMYLLLKSGDIVIYKQIHDLANGIMWGGMYLISFDGDDEEYVPVKSLQRSTMPDHVSLVSHNEQHKPLDIHLNRIRARAPARSHPRIYLTRAAPCSDPSLAAPPHDPAELPAQNFPYLCSASLYLGRRNEQQNYCDHPGMLGRNNEPQNYYLHPDMLDRRNEHKPLIFS